MRVKFHGVRGSIATAGEATRRYGGNTSCVSVHVADRTLVFDAGTGIRSLGNELLARPGRVELFFSHLHWDHIQGFPFFAPAFVPGNLIVLRAVDHGAGEGGLHAVLDGQMRAPTFPVGLDVMRAELAFEDLAPGELVKVGGAAVRHTSVDHPNGCVAYRVDHGGAAVVYATDLEHGEEPDPALVELARGADLLIYDAMYTPEEYDGVNGFSRRGWGHSTFEAGARLAQAAGVEELCLFHHDPAHDDRFMDALAIRARRRLAGTSVAREGMEFVL